MRYTADVVAINNNEESVEHLVLGGGDKACSRLRCLVDGCVSGYEPQRRQTMKCDIGMHSSASNSLLQSISKRQENCGIIYLSKLPMLKARKLSTCTNS